MVLAFVGEDFRDSDRQPIARTMPDEVEQTLKAQVARFWDDRPCGSFASDSLPGKRDFFEQVTRCRYSAQPFMRDWIDFRRFAGQRLLEVGSGLGTDLR